MPLTRSILLQRLLAAAEIDPRIVGVVDYGSSSEGRADVWSDIDLALFIRDEDFVGFEQGWKPWAAQFGPLLLAYVGGVGHPWTVYAADPIPLRVDFGLHPASQLATILTWPNAPRSVETIVLYDATDQVLTGYAAQMVGRSLHPPDLAVAFEQVAGDFWYYCLRTYSKLLRRQGWAVRYDFNFIIVGNLLALLRLEVGATERWLSSSAAVGIEQVITPKRQAQLALCIPGPDVQSLQHAFQAAMKLGQEVCGAISAAHSWSWPEEFAARMITLFDQYDVP